MTQAVFRMPAEGRTIAVVGDVYRFLATGEDTNGKYAQWEAIVPPGGGPPPHVHSREEEGFYVLEGEITFTIGDKRLVASVGMFANMPVGTPHSFKNESGKPAKMLISVAPAGLEKMFFEFPRAASRWLHDRFAAHERRDREATGGSTEVRHRDQVTGSLIGPRWQGSSGLARRHVREPPLKANATAAPSVEREALNL